MNWAAGRFDHPGEIRNEALPMLVLSRKVGERILIGDHIAVTVVRVGQGSVRIGIEAPDDLTVVRDELNNKPVANRAVASQEDEAGSDGKSSAVRPR